MDKWGISCVEHIKLLSREEFLAIFEDDKFIIKEIAKKAYDILHQTPFDISRAVAKREESPKRPGKLSAAMAQTTPMKSDDKVSVSQLLENVAQMWSFKGHQTNAVRLAVAEVLSHGYTKTDIAKVIRLQYNHDEWDGNVNSGDDKLCKLTFATRNTYLSIQRIMATLVRIHKMAKEGLLDDISPSTSKTLVKGSRGAKKGVKRGPYKKKNSMDVGQSEDADAVENDELIETENAVVDNDALAMLGEASMEMSEVQEAAEGKEEEEV
eukprot:scaffold73360_cov61-Cyclotella_meneghiniana.AAC.8